MPTTQDIEVFLQQLHYFEIKNSDVASCHGIKGRLAKNIKFWGKKSGQIILFWRH